MNQDSVAATSHTTRTAQRNHADTQQPSDLIASLPLSDFSAAQRDAMSRFCRQMESSLKVNRATGEIGVHVPALKNAMLTYCSPSFVDSALQSLGQMKDQPRLLTDGTLSADWVAAEWGQVQKVARLPSRDQVLSDLGLSSVDAKPDQWKNALSTKFPEMADPKLMVKFQDFVRSDVHKDASGAAWVQCLVRDLGWWLVAVALWALVAFILSIAPGGQVSWALWGILVACGVGAMILGKMLHCAENPNG